MVNLKQGSIVMVRYASASFSRSFDKEQRLVHRRLIFCGLICCTENPSIKKSKKHRHAQEVVAFKNPLH